MRRGEQFGLKWENVDLERGILIVTGKAGPAASRLIQLREQLLPSC
jgi:integrase